MCLHPTNEKLGNLVEVVKQGTWPPSSQENIDSPCQLIAFHIKAGGDSHQRGYSSQLCI